MSVEERPYVLRRSAAFDFLDGVNRVKEALREQGFAIAATLDAGAPLGEACSVLGVWDADLVRRALEADPEAGALLPLSVVIHERDGGIVVEAIDPTRTLGAVGDEALAAIAAEARARLARALDRLPPGRRR